MAVRVSLASDYLSALHILIAFSFADVLDKKVEERQQEVAEKRERDLQELRGGEFSTRAARNDTLWKFWDHMCISQAAGMLTGKATVNSMAKTELHCLS